MKRWSVALGLVLVGALAGSLLVGPLFVHSQAPNNPIVFPKELTSYRDVAKKVLPAVVSIESRAKPKKVSTPRRRGPALDESQVPEEFRKFFDQFGQQMPDFAEEGPSHGFGSGFLVDPKGVILTNHHVVAGADQVEVQLQDGRKFVSKEIHSDPKTDLAIVRIAVKEPVPFLEMGDSDAMEIGDRVLAVGAPFGLTGSVTAGIVSAKGRNGFSPRKTDEINAPEDFLQTDAAINPGNSGGPLVNLEGKVIGINSMIKSRSGGFQGVGLAIASNMAKNVMLQLMNGGIVHRGYLGVKIKDVDSEVAAKLGLKDQTGVQVAAVMDTTPAAKAGLKAGDIITSVAGKPVKSSWDLQRVIAMLPLNKPVDVAVFRDDKTKVVQVTIEEQPEKLGPKPVSAPRSTDRDQDTLVLDKIGVELTDVTPDAAEKLGYKESAAGALIAKVDPDSIAAEAGLRRGMLIVKVEKKTVKTAAEAQEKLNKASLDKGVLLQVQSPQGGGTSYLVLKAETATK